MATTPQDSPIRCHPVHPGRFIGRVGGLAVALGIGLAIANSPAVAMADDAPAASNPPSSSPSEQSSDNEASPDTTDEDPDGAEEDGGNVDAEDLEDTDEEAVTEDLDDRGDRDDGDESADSDDADQDEPDSAGPEQAGVELESPPALETAETDEPADDESGPAAPAAALLTMTGSARREVGTEAITTAAPPTTTATTTLASPLGTEQQLEAERIAAQTVKTWPVKLMKFVLSLGWLATAAREYKEAGGVDWENLKQLDEAIDEYAMGAAFQQQLLNSMDPTVVTQVAPPHTWYGQTVGGSRILYDNPDTIYRFMGVNKTSTYVITGKFAGQMPADTSFSVLTGLSGVTADYLGGRDIDIAPDGSFAITVGSQPRAQGQRNYLQLTAESTLIAVRNTLSDWNNQPPMSLEIERTTGPRNSLFSQLGGFAIPLLGPTVANSPFLTALVSLIPPLKNPPPILRGTFTAVVMALGLSMESKYIKVATTDPETGERAQPNELRDPTRNAEFLATQLQSAGYFNLADTEALVVTVTPKNARYFTVPVTNLWTVTDDYRNEQTSLNIAQAKANPVDGSYTLVISSQDPGVYNWVSTGGLNRGTISIRFQDLDLTSTVTPTVHAEVVRLSLLGSVLPPTTKYVTAAERQTQLTLRKAGFDKRFAPYTQS